MYCVYYAGGNLGLHSKLDTPHLEVPGSYVSAGMMWMEHTSASSSCYTLQVRNSGNWTRYYLGQKHFSEPVRKLGLIMFNVLTESNYKCGVLYFPTLWRERTP